MDCTWCAPRTEVILELQEVYKRLTSMIENIKAGHVWPHRKSILEYILDGKTE